MKLINSPELNDYLDELESVNELNLSISDLLFSLLGKRDITNKKEIDVLQKNSGYTTHSLLMNKVSEFLDIDLEVEDNEEIFNKHIAGAINELEPHKYLNNPYYKNIKITDFKDKDFALIYDKYTPYEIFAYLDMKADSNFYEINSLGYFKEEFPFIALNYQGVTWMSITPNEIETMELSINKVQGDVIVFGLGLGYFAYMALLKEDVNKVTVIEKDARIVALFKKHLLPQFPNVNKLQIIVDDANHYLNKNLNYDYAFIDLWHDPLDGLDFFLKFKKSEKLQSKCQFLYWLESSFYLLLRRCFITLLLEAREGYDDSHYKVSETIEDKIINQYYFYTKNLTISSKAQLIDLLSDKSLLDLLLNH